MSIAGFRTSFIRVDFPDPLTPVTNVSVFKGNFVLMFFRLYWFIPSIDMFDFVLSSIKPNKFYNINDLMKVTKLKEYDIYLAIVFLIKYGFITTVGNKNE